MTAKLLVPPGTRFGLWTVLEEMTIPGHRRRHYCVCDCGAKRSVAQVHLIDGSSRSCGCVAAEKAAARITTHGMSSSPEYFIYRDMLRRCYEPHRVGYEYYGDREINVCDRWKNSFEAFYEDMGPRPEGMTLERKDTQLGYTPENCIWDTTESQANNKRNNVHLTCGGVTMTMARWCRRLGMSAPTVCRRLKEGWPVERALMTPVKRLPRRG